MTFYTKFDYMITRDPKQQAIIIQFCKKNRLSKCNHARFWLFCCTRTTVLVIDQSLCVIQSII